MPDTDYRFWKKNIALQKTSKCNGERKDFEKQNTAINSC